MAISLSLINGMMLGVEIVNGDEDFQNCFVVDLLIVRIMFHWGSEE